MGAFRFRVFDPTRDVERYFWDLTDCRGSSVLDGGARLRRGLSSGRTAGQDTVEVIGAFEHPPGAGAARCAALRVVDQAGNTTPVAELPLTNALGAPPTASAFNAYTVGAAAIRTDLAASDADGDFAGAFMSVRLRDGVLFAPDGQPDMGIYNVSGYLGTVIPDLPLGGRVQYGDVYAVIVYLIDAAGNFTRLEDADVLR